MRPLYPSSKPLCKHRVGSFSGRHSFFGIAVRAATLTGIVPAIQWTLDIIGSPLLGAIGDRMGRRRCMPIVYAGGARLLGCAGFSSGIAWMLVCAVLFFCCAAQLIVMVSA
ncbi:MAG: hypothetical protein JRH18_24345, partial [Deltaproteobacteria bacterium]|nr:hypothetical protein [Deltaproteobacteria bacterium]